MTTWLDPAELRIGLGCMRLPSDEELAHATIGAAAEAGITVFDTARAYGDNERLLARALRECGAADRARIVTKGGMARPGGTWIPDGRARSISVDCEASLEALDGLPIDTYLLHTPDPRRPWGTSVRALARLVDQGLVGRVGVCNVNRMQLDEAAGLAPISCAQVALSVLDDTALRGGLVDRCEELGITLLAHSALGGPRRVARLAKDARLVELGAAQGATAAEIALVWLLGLSPTVVAVVGAREPEAARSAARAASLQLDESDRARLGQRRPQPIRPRGGSDVVVVMGVPGAGKSRVAEQYVAKGYLRLNRDERGGTLRDLAEALEDALTAGARKIVLDNTYLTRALRSHVVETAARHGSDVRCIWLDTPLAQAQVNLVERLLDRFAGTLPLPAELRAASRSEPGLLTATQQMRTFRELEPPLEDEGFTTVERVPFARAGDPTPGPGGVLVAVPALMPGWRSPEPSSPHLLFDWRPDGDATELEALRTALAHMVTGAVDAALCPHPGGPPSCWCRPPLPGLALAFARRHGVDLTRSLVVGTSAAHRTLAASLGVRYVAT